VRIDDPLEGLAGLEVLAGLDLEDTIPWWINQRSGAQLYSPQGYEGLETQEGVLEFYLNSLVDHDLEIHYCISVRCRPYRSGWTLNGATPPEMNEVRDHLFVTLELLKTHPDQTRPNWRAAWMGRPHNLWSHPTQREILGAFADFIEGKGHSRESQWADRVAP
jgi:hypothetical protein